MRARACGTIHNLSADSRIIFELREANVIPSIINNLKDSSCDICQSCAGTLQNISQEITSRNEILSGNNGK